MSGPRKPWDVPGTNFHANPMVSTPTGLNSHPGLISMPPGTAMTPGMPNIFQRDGVNNLLRPNQPQMPPRPPPPMYNNLTSGPIGVGRPMQPLMYGGQSMSYGGSLYNSPFSSYGSMYNSSPFSSYGGGYGRFGMSGGYGGQPGYGLPDSNGFVQMAEESSRPAFQSIEAIVHAAGSVSMMLESTYSALYSSFRAVIGVAHHFGLMKDKVSQIVSALAVIRSIRWLYRKILFTMGLSKVNPTVDQIWDAMTQNMNEGQKQQQGQKSNWPIIMFFAVIFGAPWLIWRILMSVSGVNSKVTQKWITGEGDHFAAVGEYDYRAQAQQELSFKRGQAIRIAPEGVQPQCQGWLLASVDGKNVGYVPVNYIKIRGKVSKPAADAQAPTTTHNESSSTGFPEEKPPTHSPSPLTNDVWKTHQEGGDPLEEL